MQSAECLQTLQGHAGSVLAVDFSSNGRFLVNSGYEQIIHLRSAETGECLKLWQAHNQSGLAATIRPNNQQIATGGELTEAEIAALVALGTEGIKIVT